MSVYKNLDESLISVLSGIATQNTRREIVAGQDYIPVTGKVLDSEDLLMGIDSYRQIWQEV
jgi:CDP-6-deoxy-D-xylo-4-hexulose-3-dehydrase